MAAAWGAAAGYRADAGVPASQRRFGRSFVTGTGANVPLNGSGFPTTLNAFPVTARALPICNQQPTTTSVQCHAAQVPGSSPIGTAQVPVPSLPGLQPATLQRIYLNPQNIPAAGGQNQTVAAVVAYTNPNLESDLNVYRKEFNLPPCTSASGCLKIVQQGSVGTDPQDLWPIESALDAEMISAMCFQCKIMVVETADATIPNLAAAEDLAVQNGATVISNSWSIPESPGALTYSSHFSHPGVTITAGAGDGGYGVGFPADLSTIVSVGGTAVQRSATGSYTQSVWSQTGSGCSMLVSKPAWQTDPGCPGRTVNDIAVVADPTTGVAAWSTDAGGWVVLGGTSVGAPIVAAMYAVAGTPNLENGAASLYTASGLQAVTGGSNGGCDPAYLCTASGSGYNAPTGNGTPSNLNPFAANAQNMSSQLPGSCVAGTTDYLIAAPDSVPMEFQVSPSSQLQCLEQLFQNQTGQGGGQLLWSYGSTSLGNNAQNQTLSALGIPAGGTLTVSYQLPGGCVAGNSPLTIVNPDGVTTTALNVSYQDSVSCVLQILQQYTNSNNQGQQSLFLNNGTYLQGGGGSTLASSGVSAANSTLQLVDQAGAYVSQSKITIPPMTVVSFTATSPQNNRVVAIPYDGYGQSAPCAVILNQQPVTPVQNPNGTFTWAFNMLGTTLGGECKVLVGQSGGGGNGILTLQNAMQAAQIQVIVQL